MVQQDNKQIWTKINSTANWSKKEAGIIYRKVQKIVKENYSKPFVVVSLSNKTIDNGTRVLQVGNTKGFDAVVINMQKELINDYDIELSKKDFAGIAQRKSVLLDNITINSTQLKTSVKQLMLQNIGRGLSFNQMVEGISILHPSYKQYSYTIANTGIQHMYKDTQWTKVSDEFEYFIYAGPQDAKNRNYCADHVGKVYTRQQVEEQGIQSEIMSFYNCRHTLDPITEEEFTAKGGVT